MEGDVRIDPIASILPLRVGREARRLHGAPDRQALPRCGAARSERRLAATSPADALHGWLRECARLDASDDSPVESHEPAWELRAPLGAGESRGLVRVRLDGRNCCTRIQRIATTDLRHEGAGTSEDHSTLLLVDPTTGMRHQIRAHLAWIGLPIRGDTDYGGAHPNEPRRLHLHAARLDLSAAVPGEEAVVCPPTADFWPPVAGEPRE